MPIIETRQAGPLRREAEMCIPSMYIPGFRRLIAEQDKTENNLLIQTNGGIGDLICAEPAIRFATQHFGETNISLESDHPELFQHLKFKNVYDTHFGKA